MGGGELARATRRLSPSRTISEADLDAVCAAAHDSTDEEIAGLATVLADSGARLPFRSDAADVASTGGPSSLTTLVCPVLLRALGFVVPKLGVRGRPAGGIDVLETLPGFRSELTYAEVLAALDLSGVAHAAAADTFAPLDALLFARRQATGTQQVPALVIASLLSKKLAMGVHLVGLDVRVAPHGNFGSTWEEARDNARRFCIVASMLGMRATCFLTDATRPYQRHVGRGEAVVALDTWLDGEMDADLSLHIDDCWTMAESTTGVDGRATVGTLRTAFDAHLRAQGTSVDALHLRARAVTLEPRASLVAERTGLLWCDLGGIRDVLVDQQRISAAAFTDPCGVTLGSLSSPIVPGSVIADVRSTTTPPAQVAEMLRQFVGVVNTSDEVRPIEEVRY